MQSNTDKQLQGYNQLIQDILGYDVSNVGEDLSGSVDSATNSVGEFVQELENIKILMGEIALLQADTDLNETDNSDEIIAKYEEVQDILKVIIAQKEEEKRLTEEELLLVEKGSDAETELLIKLSSINDELNGSELQWYEIAMLILGINESLEDAKKKTEELREEAKGLVKEYIDYLKYQADKQY